MMRTVFPAALLLVLAAVVGMGPSARGQAPPAPPDVKAPPADAQKNSSGLAWKILTPGRGTARPGPASTVMVRYSGWTPDGKLFDSSLKESITFALDEVIPGWTQGLQMMRVGEKRRFWIPGALAYDKAQGGPGVPKGMLVFEIELLGIIPPRP